MTNIHQFIKNKTDTRKADRVWPYACHIADIRTEFINDNYNDEQLMKDLKGIECFDTVHSLFFSI